MIIDKSRHLGTHSASGVLNEARKKPALRKAVSRASRRWWQAAVESEGADYPILRFPTRLSFSWRGEPIEIPAGSVMLGDRTWMGRNYFWWSCIRHGAAEATLWLAHPHRVFDCAAREHGLSCRVCLTAERADQFRDDFMCRRCLKRSHRFRSTEHFMLRLISEDLKAKQRALKQSHGETA